MTPEGTQLIAGAAALSIINFLLMFFYPNVYTFTFMIFIIYWVFVLYEKSMNCNWVEAIERHLVHQRYVETQRVYLILMMNCIMAFATWFIITYW
jgi:hypothetical protein